MKKVWIVNHYAEPPEGGKYLRHFNFAKKLINRGYDVTIFTASTIHNTKINNTDGISPYLTKEIERVKFVFIKTDTYFGNGFDRVKNMMQYYFGVKKAYKDFGDVDVVYTSGPHPLAWLAAKHVAKKMRAKLLVETRDLWPETFVAMEKFSKNHPVALLLYAIEKKVYKAADKLIFTFPGGDEYVKNIGLDASKVVYINNGIDLLDFKQKISNYYNNSKYSESDFKVVFTGAMGRANAVDSLVKAAEIIQNSGNSDIRVYLFGHGTEEEELKKYVEEKNLNNVIFMGKVKKDYIPNILSRADLNILSLAHLPGLFKYGLSPNKLFEYFASGKPTISNVECGHDLLEKYGAGYTVKPVDPKYLAEGILDFYNMSTEKYNEYSKNSLIAAEDFDFDILTDRLVDAIEN